MKTKMSLTEIQQIRETQKILQNLYIKLSKEWIIDKNKEGYLKFNSKLFKKLKLTDLTLKQIKKFLNAYDKL